MPPALLPELVAERVHDRHRQAQALLLDVVAARLTVQLAQLPNLSPDAEAVYAAGAAQVVATGQRRAAELAAGYALTLAPAPARDPLELELGELAVTADTPWIRSPIIRARTELGAGATWAAAIAVAASKARGYASGDLQAAQRHGLAAGGRAARATGYRKVLASGACAWCRDVASGVYARPDSVPFHERDACSVAPVYDLER